MKRIIFGDHIYEYCGRVTLEGNGWTIEDIDQLVKHMGMDGRLCEFTFKDCIYEMYRYEDGALTSDLRGSSWSFHKVLFNDVPEDVATYFCLMTEGKYT